jgi:hypothetical protein
LADLKNANEIRGISDERWQGHGKKKDIGRPRHGVAWPGPAGNADADVRFLSLKWNYLRLFSSSSVLTVFFLPIEAPFSGIGYFPGIR